MKNNLIIIIIIKTNDIMKNSFAIVLLVASSQALRINGDPTSAVKTPDAVRPINLHWNEDPHSVPNPLIGGPDYMTSTQARFVAENSTANAKSVEPKYWGPADWHFASEPYNAHDREYVGIESDDDDSDDDLELGSESSDDSTDDDVQDVQLKNKWHVAPDYGELDHNVVLREHDIKNGEKASGWTNPLGWTDDGADDDLVV